MISAIPFFLNFKLKSYDCRIDGEALFREILLILGHHVAFGALAVVEVSGHPLDLKSKLGKLLK